jgi:hypothetical protein
MLINEDIATKQKLSITKSNGLSYHFKATAKANQWLKQYGHFVNFHRWIGLKRLLFVIVIDMAAIAAADSKIIL